VNAFPAVVELVAASVLLVDPRYTHWGTEGHSPHS